MFKFCTFCGNKINKQSKDGFQCTKCKKWTHYASNPAVSVVVKAGNEALIGIRGIEPGKGAPDIVGGFLRYGEDPITGAVREFKEETGVTLKSGQLQFLGIWIDTYFYQGQNQWVLNIIYLLELDKKFTGKPADDVEELVWVSLSDKPKFAFPYLYKVWQKIKG